MWRGTSGPAGRYEDGAARVIQRIGCRCQPRRVIPGGGDEAVRRAQIDSSPEMVHVLPARLIGETELVVAGPYN
jgi:hypothetical protein